MLKPILKNIPVKQNEEKEEAVGGIYLGKSRDEFNQKAIVIAVGSPCEVKEGDKVLLQKFAGTEIQIDGEKYRVVIEDEILAIFENAE